MLTSILSNPSIRQKEAVFKNKTYIKMNAATMAAVAKSCTASIPYT